MWKIPDSLLEDLKSLELPQKSQFAQIHKKSIKPSATSKKLHVKTSNLSCNVVSCGQKLFCVSGKMGRAPLWRPQDLNNILSEVLVMFPCPLHKHG